MKEDPMFGTGWCTGAGIGGWLLMALLWGGFLAVVIWAVTRLFPRTRSPGSLPGGSGEHDIANMLDRKLASGEIDEDTYHQLRGELTRTS
jgi:putative membrane protein